MKTLSLWASAIALLLCLNLNAQTPVSKSAKTPKNESVVFAVSDMHEEHCKIRIEKNVGFEKGVKDLQVNLKANTVTIKFDPQKTTVAALQKAISNLGYPTTVAPAKQSATTPTK
jgi:copper chaperone CopZ